jgi:hypothetical protein
MTTRKHAFYGVLALVSLLGLGITQSARASYIVTLQEVGSNVVANGSGTIDYTDLTLSNSGTTSNQALIGPSAQVIQTGPTGPVNFFTYSGLLTVLTSFGSGGITHANTGSGDFVGIGTALAVPQGYVSGAALSDSMTFNSATFATLGVTPGTYVATWGTGVHADSFTLQIGPAGVPDAGSTLPLLSFASLGLVALRRKLRC